MITISGTVVYCSNPSLNPVPGVTLSLTGDATDSTLSDGSGNYSFSENSGGNYVVTPSKAALPPASSGIDTVDSVAVQMHYLGFTFIPPGCRLTAADVNADSLIDTVDAIAIQRFYLGYAVGIGNAGKYKFSPLSRTYTAVVTNQMLQDYDALIFGDVASGFVYLPEGGPSQDGAGNGTNGTDGTVATVTLPNAAVDPRRADFSAEVTTSAIDPNQKLIGFQGDFIFDERMVTFQEPPVQNAGLTASNWNVSGHVLPGPGPAAGPIKTLRISAFSLDLTPLSGEGTLFELRMTRVNQSGGTTQLLWVAPPNFLFIDSDLQTHKPGTAVPGSVESSKR